MLEKPVLGGIQEWREHTNLSSIFLQTALRPLKQDVEETYNKKPFQA